ncbi:MAG: isoquinoline 1-oxidoreductase subunit beta, partial [Frankiaceae bacterium]|nr:isoquinoline 1-oxidoreductase subunit beta [Frankiaceae bacterium]
VNKDGTASFALPRAEVGQGITTAFTMLIADEMDLPMAKVHVHLEKARPALMFNQLTGGSNSIRSLYTPVRQAAAVAKGQLMKTAAKQWKVNESSLRTANGVITAKDGRTATYGSLASAAAATRTTAVTAKLKAPSQFKIVGKSQTRVDAHDIVTGRKKFAMDYDIPGAMPAMICRAPTINGTVKRIHNRAAVLKMDGITHVVPVTNGVAVRGRTFGQCIDAVRALKVTWGPGSADSHTESGIHAELVKAELPFAATSAGGATKTIEQRFTFYFASNSALETSCAVARVTKTTAQVWASLKVPIVAQKMIADKLGFNPNKVTVHVAQGGGSFGRHLFPDVAVEAAEIAQKTGKPVKLMWHRTDDFRHGRVHPMCINNVRATYQGKNVVSFEQRHTSVDTDFRHGFGDVITAFADTIPGSNELGYAQTIFELTQNVSYNYGPTSQTLSEVDMSFHTGSMRNIYSPDVCVAQELITDALAKAMRIDPYDFRHQFLKDARSRAVLQEAKKLGKWGRKMPKGTAQGIAFHAEYKGCTAAVVDIDCGPHMLHRKIPRAYTGPRVTRVAFVADVGLPINPRGLRAQMMGGIMDGIALALTSSLHLKQGHFLEGSWDNYWYTRQWNVPPELKIVIMPPTTGKPGGAGELGVAASKAAVACAYGRATGMMPTSFPINHNKPLGFKPLPTIPPIPQSPTNGLTAKI